LTIDLLNNPEGFENGWGNWSVSGSVWQVGVPTSGPSAAHTGSRVAGTILNGSYPDNVNAYLISPWFAVPALLQQPELRFWSWYDTASANDYGQLWIRTVSFCG
jgi:bacillopeptidase F